jgi:hypothetical protein
MIKNLILGLTLIGLINTNLSAHETQLLIESNSIPLNKEPKELKKYFSNEVRHYLQAYNNKNWEVVTDMIYPKLFQFMSKEQLVELFTKMENDGMLMVTSFKSIEKISDVIKYENEKYCRVFYNGNITIELSGFMLEKKDELVKNFKQIYGSKNVLNKKDSDTILIKASKSMIAIAQINANDWKYIEYNPELISMMLPALVIGKL